MIDQNAYIKWLVIRGVPARTIASSLKVPLDEILDVANDSGTITATALYQQKCIEAADIKNAPLEAAEYLYFRGVSNSMVRKLCRLPAGYWFDVEAKYQHQCKQLELAHKKFVLR